VFNSKASGFDESGCCLACLVLHDLFGFLRSSLPVHGSDNYLVAMVRCSCFGCLWGCRVSFDFVQRLEELLRASSATHIGHARLRMELVQRIVSRVGGDHQKHRMRDAQDAAYTHGVVYCAKAPIQNNVACLFKWLAWFRGSRVLELRGLLRIRPLKSCQGSSTRASSLD